jgi:uncharacterized protein
MPPRSSEAALVVELVRIDSGSFVLEGELAYGDEPTRGGVVLAGPHPLLGGTMTNNVVRALGDGVAEQGVATLRFNYRGVGNSTGPALDTVGHLAQFWRTSHVSEELGFCDDLIAAVAWMRRTLDTRCPLALIGYSFGCSLLPLVGADAFVPLILVAPTVGTHDYETFGNLANPLLVIASEDDFSADASKLRHWFDSLRGPRQLVLGRYDNHFFRGHESWLVETIHAFVDDTWSKNQ